MQKYIFIILFSFISIQAMQSGEPNQGLSHEDLLKQQLIKQILETMKKTKQLNKENSILEQENEELERVHNLQKQKKKCYLNKPKFYSTLRNLFIAIFVTCMIDLFLSPQETKGPIKTGGFTVF